MLLRVISLTLNNKDNLYPWMKILDPFNSAQVFKKIDIKNAC